jgi:hypothetical protein
MDMQAETRLFLRVKNKAEYMDCFSWDNHAGQKKAMDLMRHFMGEKASEIHDPVKDRGGKI